MLCKLKRKIDYFYTGYTIMTALCFGYLFTLFATITVDMKYILNTTMGMISLYTTVDTVGRLFGAAVPLSYQYLNRQLVMALVYILLTISVAVTPLLPNLWLLFVSAFINGVSSACVSSSYPVWLMEIWKGQSANMLQLSEFAFGIGSIIAPTIMRPYLVGEVSGNSHLFGTTSIQFSLKESMNETVVNSQGVSAEERKNRLMWPTMITGVCILIVPMSSLIAYYIKPYKASEEDIDLNNNQIATKLFDRKDTPRKTMRVLFALWYASHFVFENIFLKFVVTYMQYCPLQLSAPKSAQIFSIASAVFTAFCGINIFVTLRVKMTKIIYIAYIAMSLGIILMVFGQHNVVLMWVSNVVISAGLAPMYASTYAFTGEQLTFSDHMSGGFMLLRAVLTLLTPIVIGIYIEQYSTIFIIIEGFFFACSFLLFNMIFFFVKKYNKIL